MKKATSKPVAKTPAPAKSLPAAPKAGKKPTVAKPAPAPVPVPVVKKPKAKPAAKAPKVGLTIIPVEVAPSAPEVVATPKAVIESTLTAVIDVGFGNALYIRGEGAGLSWDKGVALTNVNSDTWTITFPETAQPIVFKLLVNDLMWSIGEDYVLAPGATVSVSPAF